MVKDPDDILDYPFYWGDELIPLGDTIISSAFILPDDLTLESESFNDTTTVPFISGGVLGKTYEVTNRINTAGGRQYDKTIEIEIEQK